MSVVRDNGWDLGLKVDAEPKAHCLFPMRLASDMGSPVYSRSDERADGAAYVVAVDPVVMILGRGVGTV